MLSSASEEASVKIGALLSSAQATTSGRGSNLHSGGIFRRMYRILVVQCMTALILATQTNFGLHNFAVWTPHFSFWTPHSGWIPRLK